jgi:hypothetical protein
MVCPRTGRYFNRNVRQTGGGLIAASCTAPESGARTGEITAARWPGPRHHKWRSDTRSLPCSRRAAIFRNNAGSGQTSRRTAPAERMSVHDQLRITAVATKPISWSIQTQPNCRPQTKPMMTSNDTAASAII